MSKEFYPSSYHKERIAQLIMELKQHGSSLIMNYGEDSDEWEVAFISNGKRYRSSRIHLLHALEEVQEKAKADV